MEVGISGYGPWSARTLRIARPFPTSSSVYRHSDTLPCRLELQGLAKRCQLYLPAYQRWGTRGSNLGHCTGRQRYRGLGRPRSAGARRSHCNGFPSLPRAPPKPHPPGRGRSGFCTKLLVKRQFPHRAAALAWNHLVMLQRTRGLEHESFTGLAVAWRAMDRLDPWSTSRRRANRSVVCLQRGYGTQPAAAPSPAYALCRDMSTCHARTYIHTHMEAHLFTYEYEKPTLLDVPTPSAAPARPADPKPCPALPCPALRALQSRSPPSCCRFSQICQQAMWLILALPPRPRPPRKGTTAASSSV